MVIQFFDKDIITINAFKRSFKSSGDLYVNGRKKKRVPRKSMYNTKLNRILVNWLSNRAGIEVTGQWHLIKNVNKDNKDAYSDIVITEKSQVIHQTIILKLLAIATRSELNEHFKKMLKYAVGRDPASSNYQGGPAWQARPWLCRHPTGVQYPSWSSPPWFFCYIFFFKKNILLIY